jgi:hypothetical protein
VDESITNLRELQTAQHHLCRKPFLKSQPLWDLTLFPNYNGQGSAIALRIHHVITDGVGHVALLQSLHGDKPFHRPSHFQPLSRSTTRLTEWVSYFVHLFHLYLHQYRLSLAFLIDFNFNSWIKPESQRSRSLTFYESNHLKLSTLKSAAKSCHHSASEVILAAFSTALREDMEAHQEPVPPTMSAIYPFPKPNHPGSLSNHTYLSSIVLPVGELDRTQQLLQLSSDFALKRWSAPLLNSAISLFGSFIQITQWMPNIGPMASLAVTSFALPSNLTLFGGKVLRSSFVFDVAEHIPVVAMLIGYEDHMNILVKGRDDVWPTEDRPRQVVTSMIKQIKQMAKDKQNGVII